MFFHTYIYLLSFMPHVIIGGWFSRPIHVVTSMHRCPAQVQCTSLRLRKGDPLGDARDPILWISIREYIYIFIYYRYILHMWYIYFFCYIYLLYMYILLLLDMYICIYIYIYIYTHNNSYVTRISTGCMGMSKRIYEHIP